MTHFTLIIACVFASLSIILGAFGAHALKKVLSPERLASFEVGVRYQMYSAITLLILGFNLSFTTFAERFAIYTIVLGTILFSFSIYLLSFSEIWNKKLRFLGPITPLGGMLMIMGWISLLISLLP